MHLGVCLQYAGTTESVPTVSGVSSFAVFNRVMMKHNRIFDVRYLPIERVQVFFNLYDSVFVVFFWCLGRLFCTHGAALRLPSTTPWLRDPRLFLFLDDRATCQCHSCQRL